MLSNAKLERLKRIPIRPRIPRNYDWEGNLQHSILPIVLVLLVETRKVLHERGYSKLKVSCAKNIHDLFLNACILIRVDKLVKIFPKSNEIMI